MKKRISFTVVNKNDSVIYKGAKLSELIETTIINTLNSVDKRHSILTKLEKDTFSYYCELNKCFLNSKYYNWENIKIIELIHNNKDYINKEDFIYFKKNKILLKKQENHFKYKKQMNI